MKTLKTILATLFFVVICVSCSKDDEGSEVSTKELNPKFIGTWRFTEVLSSGGFTVVTDYFFQFKANGEVDNWFGTPSNPVRHGDVLPPYMELVKGNIKFDYKKLRKFLNKMQLETTETDLQALISGKDGKKKYMWVVSTACPEIKCRVLRIDAGNGKIIADIKPE